MTKKRTAKLFLLACALFLLGACGTETQEKTASQEAIKSTTSSKSKKALAPSLTTAREETTATGTEKETPTTSNQTSTEANTQNQADSVSTPSTPTNSAINLQSLVDGDFSSIAGTWQNDLGYSLTITSDGSVSLSQNPTTYSIKYNQLANNTFFGTIFNPNSPTDGQALLVIPAGTQNPHYQTAESVSNVDRLLLGQDENADMHPYYRQ